MDSNEIYTTALNNALDEMRKVCPDIQHAFIYNENGELIAGDAETPQKVTTRVIDAFDDILERAEAIGGVEAITINGDMGTVKLYHFNEHYLVAVYSAKAEVGYVDTVVRVLVPTVLKVLEKLSPTPLKNVAEPKPEPLGLEKPQEGELTEKPVEKLPAEIKPEAEPSLASEKLQESPSPLEVPAVQLIVENIGGLLVPSDTVRVDSETLSSWENAFEGKKIEYVEIETFNGKTARYKVKPIKDSKYTGKAVVQIPEKVQLALEIKKGELVKVKPVIE
jgi:predicted regulator of Ras-like GTPase activity (Roadblock/LC7/MglB family)